MSRVTIASRAGATIIAPAATAVTVFADFSIFDSFLPIFLGIVVALPIAATAAFCFGQVYLYWRALRGRFFLMIPVMTTLFLLPMGCLLFGASIGNESRATYAFWRGPGQGAGGLLMLPTVPLAAFAITLGGFLMGLRALRIREHFASKSPTTIDHSSYKYNPSEPWNDPCIPASIRRNSNPWLSGPSIFLRFWMLVFFTGGPMLAGFLTSDLLFRTPPLLQFVNNLLNHFDVPLIVKPTGAFV